MLKTGWIFFHVEGSLRRYAVNPSFPRTSKGPYLFSPNFLLGRGNVGSFQPYFVSFVVITSIRSFFVVKCFHRFSGLGECGLCFGSGLGEVVDEVLSRLAFNFSMGFESFVGMSSMVKEERRLSSRRLFFVVI